MDICQLDPSSYEIVYRLTNEEKEFAEDFARRHGLKLKSPNHIVGLNTGAGSRWPQKKWTEKGYLSLIRLLRKNIKDVTILLYGGTEERERNKTIKKIANTESVINTGHDHSIRKFAALLSIPEIIVTGDTLAMHIAIALGKKMVVLFGPTSNAEIDLYGRGEKIYPEMDCLVCYKQFCDKNPTCMESITPESVYQAIIKMLP
jgi:heptosyltransferase-2